MENCSFDRSSITHVLPPEDKWVQPNAPDWIRNGGSPRVPSLQDIITATQGLDLSFPKPDTPEGQAALDEEIEELVELSQLRDVPGALYSNVPGRERRGISRFLQLRPQPYSATYNLLTPTTEPVIRTGRELARWFESDTPGLAERLALNYLLPQMGWSPPRQARVWCALDCALYGALLGAWYYKWECPQTRDRPRPVQVAPYGRVSVLYDVKPNGTFSGDGAIQRPTYTVQVGDKTQVKPWPSPGTPRHPAFPSGHSTVAGAGEAILSYFFPEFTSDAQDLADNQGLARMWAGIHYRSDHVKGLALGRAIAGVVIGQIAQDGGPKSGD